VFTTETLDGVATPVTVPPALSPDEEPPLQALINKAKVVKAVPSFASAKNLFNTFMMALLLSC
jgi:hypothetical protein